MQSFLGNLNNASNQLMALTTLTVPAMSMVGAFNKHIRMFDHLIFSLGIQSNMLKSLPQLLGLSDIYMTLFLTTPNAALV